MQPLVKLMSSYPRLREPLIREMLTLRPEDGEELEKHMRPLTPRRNDHDKASFQVRKALSFMNLRVY